MSKLSLLAATFAAAAGVAMAAPAPEARPNPTGDGVFEAARRGDVAAIKTFLSAAKPDVRDAVGRTPLMAAAQACQPVAIGLLLEAGADPSLKDAAGDTAHALARRNPGEPACGEAAKRLDGGGPH